MKKPETKLQRLKRLRAKHRLEKAAPEMLAALEWTETQLVIKDVRAPDTLKRIRDALRKAKGE